MITPPSGVDLAALAPRATYTGSPEHKSAPSFAGPPKLRADATKCDPKLGSQADITSWLQEALAAGRIGGPWENDFPRYVWHDRNGCFYEARLTNSINGDYKGYPITEAEYRSIK